MKFDGVFEGGGVKLPALAGAFEGIVNKGFEPSHMAGTSAGAITASCIAAGYRPDELKKIIMDTDFRTFRDASDWRIWQFWNLVRRNGVFNGDVFYRYIKDTLAAKNVHTFKDLRDPDPENKRYTYRFKCMASDITSGSLLSLPDDLPEYGFDPDEFEVALAVRMSMSIPFFFKPVILENKHEERIGRKHTIVDGGMISNYPIWIWDSEDEPAWPTFGFLLYSDKEDKPIKTTNPVNSAIAMFQCMLKANDKTFVRPDDYLNRTIPIPTGNVSSIDFDITNQRKGMLYKHGMEAAEKFMKDWNFNRYKRWAVNSRSRNL
jgi:NTE family protein